jgi:hypothetical protein
MRPRSLAASSRSPRSDSHSGGTSASDVASVAVGEAYRRVRWTAATLAVVAALMALAWLGNEPPERRRAN